MLSGTTTFWVNLHQLHFMEKDVYGTFLNFGNDAAGKHRGIFVKQKPEVIMGEILCQKISKQAPTRAKSSTMPSVPLKQEKPPLS